MKAVPQRLLRAEFWRTAHETPLAPDTRRVLPSGHRMPLLGLGTWQLNYHTVDTICSALDLGFRMIDTSANYRTQRGIGDAFKACGADRASLYVISKVAPDEEAYAATQHNLAELKLDYLDLILIDEPTNHGEAERAWNGLRRAKREGLTRDIGVCNFSIDRIEELVYNTGEMPAVNQIEWTPFGHSPRMLDFCRDNDIVIQAWSPLTRATRLNDDKLGSMAARYGKTAAQLVLRWNLQLGVVPLPKANHTQHQRDNLNVFNFEIQPSDMARLNGLNEHFSARERLHYL